MLHYRLPESAAENVPGLAERPGREYFARVCPDLIRIGIVPEHIVRLRDAVYCRETGIELLTPEAGHTALSRRSDYGDKQMGYGACIPELKGVLPDFRACNAVELSEGVLLFSPSAKGDKLLQCLMRESASVFFDPNMNQTAMKCGLLPLFDHSLRRFVDA